MILFLSIFCRVLMATEADLSSAKQQFWQDVEAYKTNVELYIKEATKYRNVKLNEEYRQKIATLEKNLSIGNKAILQTVNAYQNTKKDQILLDDVLLMRLAQLEFEKANFDYNEKANKTEAAITAPDYKKSLEYATRLLRMYPGSILADSAEYLIAYIYEEQAEFKKAETIYSYFLKKYPMSQYYDEVQWRLAELQFEDGNIKEARRNYLDISKRKNSKFEFKALYKLGATLYETGLYDWSSKMFIRLYERLKDDTVSSAERSTLYEETLEYLGLLGRKGIKIPMDLEIEALSTKKIQSIFMRHGLWKESEKVLIDFITKYPKSKYIPEMYNRWIDLYEQKKWMDQAEKVRNEYFVRFIDNKDWWLVNKDNYQERFLAEEQIEINLISSARYLFANKKWDLAIQRYAAFLKQYPYDPKSIDVRIELAELYYTQKKYGLAYATVSDSPNIVMNVQQKDRYFFIRLSSYYALYLNDRSKDAQSTMYRLANDYMSVAMNLEKAASILKPVVDSIATVETSEEVIQLLLQFPYDKIEYSTKSILDLLDSHIRIDKRFNKSQNISSLEQKKLEITLRKVFNLRQLASKAFQPSYDSLLYYVLDGDRFGFENITNLDMRTQIDKDIYHLLQAQLLRSEGHYLESNTIISTVTSTALKNYAFLLQAKNLYDLVDFSGTNQILAKINNPGFWQEYPEYYKLKYDVSLILADPIVSMESSISLATVLKNEAPIVEHMFKLPTDKHLAFLTSVPKGIKGALLDAIRNKKSCSGSIECAYSNWLKTKNQSQMIEPLVMAMQNYSDKRWMLSVIQQASNNDIILTTETQSIIKNWLQNNQLKFATSASYRLSLTLSKWQIPEKTMIIPWDFAYHEWLTWMGNDTNIGEYQILLQDEKYEELERKLITNHQKKDLESSNNLLKYYLFVQDVNKAKLIYNDLQAYVPEDVYHAMGYIYGFSDNMVINTNTDSPFVIAALAKQDIEKNNIKDSVRRLVTAIQQKPKEKIYYYGLMQAMMLLKDNIGFNVTLKKSIRNTNSIFAKIVDTIVEGNVFVKTNMSGIDHMMTAINDNKIEDLKVINFNHYLSLANAWLNKSKIKINTSNSFTGLQFLYSINGLPTKGAIQDGFFARSLKEVQRDIASEEKE